MSGSDRQTRLFTLTAAAAWLAFVAGAYWFDVGRGLLKDDFAWIRAARQIAADPIAIFTASAEGNFYRPIVTLSFLADHVWSGLDPRGYGITNLLLFTGCTLAVRAIARRATGDAIAAAAGAFVFAVNPHGVNMALLWLSGRTSLLMALFSCGTILAFVAGQRLAGTLLLFCALGSKEDAVAVPVIVLAARALLQQTRGRTLVLDAAAMLAATAGYFWLRGASGAMTPATAPDFYRLTFAPLPVLDNLLAYLDRAATAAAVIALLAAAVYRARPGFGAATRRVLLLSAIWFAASLAITVLVPVRSSLYALFPSIAAALACAALIESMRGRGHPGAGDRRLGAVLVACLLLVPVYRARNARWVEPSQVSGDVMRLIAADAAGFPDTGVVVFEDSADRFRNYRDVFGPLSTEAVQLVTGRPLSALVLPPGARQPVPGEVARYRLVDGRAERVTAAPPR